MDVTKIIDPLNDAQRQAVTISGKNALILAGAGSGKTRVLVHRIAWLVQVENISPWNIMAVTFTNKAAAEMRSRIEDLLAVPAKNMWVGTFHGLAHKFLRLHFKEANLPQNFQILDSQDQYRSIRQVLKDLSLDEKQWPPRQMQWQINNFKDEGVRAEKVPVGDDIYLRTIHKVYSLYEQKCQRAGVVDFAELLLKTHELMRDNQALLAFYQKRFSHILVDEFQDTNKIQYAWIRLLAGNHAKVLAVGDDDQSIYGWRGAQISNIREFTQDFPEVETLKLEQNYRSSANILNAANALIKNNPERMGKNLWTEGVDGDLINLYQAYNDLDEADFVIEKIKELLLENHTRNELAILYRSNAQSRLFEERLIRYDIPYRVYGGLRFFDRAEIKDALAYLRLIANHKDDVAFERVVNQPTRGIGLQTVALIRTKAQEQQISLYETAVKMCQSQELAARASNAVAGFISLIGRMSNETENLELAEQVEHVIHSSTLLDLYAKDKSEQGRTKIENLQELVTAAKQFISEDEEEDTPLNQFLSQAALDAGDTQGEQWEECVQLMTLHAAKGLEFPVVFLAGMEEGLFPHSMSGDDQAKLEEERRLCYVGITRAEKILYLTLADSRRHYGEDRLCRPSRFISEIPSELINEIRVGQTRFNRTNGNGKFATNAIKGRRSPMLEKALFQPGQRIQHAKFGEGTVLNTEGAGSHTRVQVSFDRVGDKWLVASFANLQTI